MKTQKTSESISVINPTKIFPNSFRNRKKKTILSDEDLTIQTNWINISLDGVIYVLIIFHTQFLIF